MLVRAGDDVALAGTTLAAVPDLAGTVVEDDVASFSDAASGVSGTLQTRVVQVATGTLDFYFCIRELAGAALETVGWNIIAAGPLSTDIDYRLDGIGQFGPGRAARRDFGTPGEPDDVKSLSFWFGGAPASGQTSRLVFVKTDATRYSRYRGMSLSGAANPDGTLTWGTAIDAFAPGSTAWMPRP